MSSPPIWRIIDGLLPPDNRHSLIAQRAPVDDPMQAFCACSDSLPNAISA